VTANISVNETDQGHIGSYLFCSLFFGFFLTLDQPVNVAEGDYYIKGIYLQFESIDFLYGAPLEKVTANISVNETDQGHIGSYLFCSLFFGFFLTLDQPVNVAGRYYIAWEPLCV
jgi:uncharacterized membrane protein (DUF106 family)